MIDKIFEWKHSRHKKFPRWHICPLSLSCWFEWWSYGMPIRIYHHIAPHNSRHWTLVEGRDIPLGDFVKIEPKCSFRCTEEPKYVSSEKYPSEASISRVWCEEHAPSENTKPIES